MSDLMLILIVITAITGLIYIVYMLLQTTGQSSAKSEDLQITSDDILEQVKILYAQKKYGIVEKLATKYLDKKPKDDELREMLAKSYLELNRVYDAMQHAMLIVKHNPMNSDMHMFLANCYLRINQGAKAITELKDVLKFDRDNLKVLKQLAKVYMEQNEKQSAIKIYLKLADLVGGNAELVKIKETIALLYIELSDFVNAISQFKDILSIYPDDISARKNLIQLYKAVKNDKKAIEVCESLLATNNDRKEELWILGNLVPLYLQVNSYEKALDAANRALLNPLSDKIALKEKVAEIYVLMGKTEESIDILKELALMNGDNIEIKKNLAKTYQVNKDYPAAVEIYKEVLEVIPPYGMPQVNRELSNLYANWAMEYYEEGKSSECFKTFNIAFSYDSENPKVYYKLGIVNQLIMNCNEAIVQYQKAIELEPDNPIYYMALADCYELVDNPYEEKKAVLEALRYDNQNVNAHFRLGLLNSNQRDNSNAIESFRRTIELEPNHIEAKYRLALLLESQGEKESAIALYKEILEQDPKHEEADRNLKMLEKQD